MLVYGFYNIKLKKYIIKKISEIFLLYDNKKIVFDFLVFILHQEFKFELIISFLTMKYAQKNRPQN